MHTRLVHVVVEQGEGSATEETGVSPGRYAGAYFEFDPPGFTPPDVKIRNMNRDLENLSAVTHGQLVERSLENEDLISGLVTVEVEDTDGGTVSASLFIHYP